MGSYSRGFTYSMSELCDDDGTVLQEEGFLRLGKSEGKGTGMRRGGKVLRGLGCSKRE